MGKGNRQNEVETSNGIIRTEIYELPTLEVLGIVEKNFEVQVYDFLAHGITSNYDGVLELVFLKKRKFCLDLPNGEITIQIDEKTPFSLNFLFFAAFPNRSARTAPRQNLFKVQ